MAGECEFYRWNSGYFCDLLFQKTGVGYIHESDVTNYCLYEGCEACPVYQKYKELNSDNSGTS